MRLAARGWHTAGLNACASFSASAFIRSKPRHCQTHWFQKFFVGWLVILGRGGSLSLQELCFQSVEAALLPKTLVSDLSCWEEVALFHCKSCAFSRSKPHYCQTDWFHMFVVELPSIGQLIIQQLHQHCLIFPSSTSQV